MNSQLPKQPFNTLALSLSGGGYRAASFHLGLLTYLDSIQWREKSLLERTRVISTVSGGTFTGVCYASALAEGKTLMDCYHKMVHFMRDINLITDGLQKLSDFNEWDSNKSRSLINAFSLVYFEKLEDKTFAHLFDNPTHLKEIIFNATEFSYGLPFRFQRCEVKSDNNNSAFLGNRQVNMPPEAIREVRLADIIAASSCFPMGFEPINFPDDFRHGDAPYLNAVTQSYHRDQWGNTCQFPIGLMDGGIVDNQGIDSVIWAEKRMRNYKGNLKNLVSDDEKSIDLYIISDVSSPFMEGYVRTEEKPMKSWRKLSFRSFRLIGALSLLFGGLAIFGALNTQSQWLGFVLGGFTFIFILAGIVSLFLSNIFNKVIKAFDVPEFFAKRLGHFSSMKFGIYETLIKNRLSSVVSMVSEVFMKQIRRQEYGRVYDDPQWYDRLIMNAIYELTPQNILYRKNKKSKFHCPELENISNELMNTALKAKSMGTSLWFTPEELKGDKNDMLSTLIACGQFSACFNLLEYTCKIVSDPSKKDEFDAYPDDLRQDILNLHKKLIKDWEAFNKDPYFMLP